MSEFTLPEAGGDTNIINVFAISMKWVIFLTVNHRGPLPLRELHSTDETIVWRDPGGSEPVYDLFTITSDFSLPEAVCDTDI